MALEDPHPRRVIYLTGAPAVGKTAVATMLAERTGADVYSYGALLTERIAQVSDQEELRARSASVITRQDVLDLDALMAGKIAAGGDCIIDSHAVTKELFGFRAIPFDGQAFRALGVSAIICLYLPPRDMADRISNDPQGRPLPDDLDLRIHQDLQMSLALSYAHTSGAPVNFIRADQETASIASTVAEICGLTIRDNR